MKAFSSREKGQYFFFLLVALGSLIMLYFLPRLAVPVGVAYVLYLLILPFVLWLERLGLSRVQGAALIFIGLLTLLIYPIILAIPFIKDEITVLQSFLPRLQEIISVKYEALRMMVKERSGFDRGDRAVQDALIYITENSKNMALKLPGYFASLLEWVFVTPIFLFFFLTEGRTFKFLLLRLVPNSIFERTYQFYHQFNRQLGDYIMAKIVEALIVGTMITIGLWFAGVQFAFLLGVVAGITNIIPYV